jgi:hypothetical protein
LIGKSGLISFLSNEPPFELTQRLRYRAEAHFIFACKVENYKIVKVKNFYRKVEEVKQVKTYSTYSTYSTFSASWLKNPINLVPGTYGMDAGCDDS